MGELMKQLQRQLKSRQVSDKVWPIAKRAFRRKKKEFIKEFNNHPITKEIERGPAARSNISGTLPGLKYEAGKGGNLFSFIGFNKADAPIEDLRKELGWRTSLKQGDVKIRQAGVSKHKVSWRVTYRAKYPTVSDFTGSITPMPFEPGSWVKKIETGNFWFRILYLAKKRWLF